MGALMGEAPDPKEPALVAIGMWTVYVVSMFGVNWLTQTNGLKLSSGPEMKPAMFALAAYFFVFYTLMARQGMGKRILNKELLDKYEDNPKIKRWSISVDRCFLNTQEQSPAFLVSFLAYSVYVNPLRGAYLALAYIALTIHYPFVYGKGLIILSSTMPRYFVIWFYLM